MDADQRGWARTNADGRGWEIRVHCGACARACEEESICGEESIRTMGCAGWAGTGILPRRRGASTPASQNRAHRHPIPRNTGAVWEPWCRGPQRLRSIGDSGARAWLNSVVPKKKKPKQFRATSVVKAASRAVLGAPPPVKRAENKKRSSKEKHKPSLGHLLADIDRG
jgi:hypothetical protein